MSSQYYKRLLKAAQTDLSNYKKRKQQLEAIQNNYSIFDDYAADVNNYCTSASLNSSLGIVISGGYNDTSNVFGKKDSGAGDDNLSMSKNYINTEILQVLDKIEALEQSINTYRTLIIIEEQKEKEEMANKG
jgi:aryl-alcohol dehydrogenase-like predicted oxidoreductase